MTDALRADLRAAIALRLGLPECPACVGDEDWLTVSERVAARACARLAAQAPVVAALRWLVNLHHGVGKAGGRPEPDEWEDALAAAVDAMNKEGK